MVTRAHELPLIMFVPLGILGIGSIFIGFFTKDLFIGLGSHFFDGSIYSLPINLIIIDAEFIPYYVKLVPSVLSLLGMVGSLFFHKYCEFFFIYFRYNIYINAFYKFLVQKWYFDYIQNEFLGNLILQFARNIFKQVDKFFLEIFGPNGISSIVYILFTHSRNLQTGYIFQYSFIMLTSILFLFLGLEIF